MPRFGGINLGLGVGDVKPHWTPGCVKVLIPLSTAIPVTTRAAAVITALSEHRIQVHTARPGELSRLDGLVKHLLKISLSDSRFDSYITLKSLMVCSMAWTWMNLYEL